MSVPSSDIAGVGALRLADVTQMQPAELAAQQDLSRAVGSAIQKAVTLPGGETSSANRPNSMLERSTSNDFVREQPMEVNTDLEISREMDQMTDKFRELYTDMTNFSVTWSIAKRTGRDVETLLKGQ